MRKETRRAKRRRTNKAGIIKAGNKELAVLLRDASQTGARVRLVIPREVPEHVTLISRMEKINASCTVVWRRGNDLGLKFDS